MGWIDDAVEVADPRRASDNTALESVLRLNPYTGVPTATADIVGAATGNPPPQDTVQDEFTDFVFQRPEELGLGEEDSQDIPLGTFKNPFGDPDKEGSQAQGKGIVVMLALVVGGLIFLNAFASGVGEGLAS